jgi:hypothetical protein
MGGLGSGSWSRWDTKPTVEAQRSIDSRWLVREGIIEPGVRRKGTLRWASADTSEDQAGGCVPRVNRERHIPPGVDRIARVDADRVPMHTPRRLAWGSPALVATSVAVTPERRSPQAIVIDSHRPGVSAQDDPCQEDAPIRVVPV